MLLALSLHIAFLLVWSATLLYFPILLMHEAAEESADTQRKAYRLQRAVYAYIMTPSALLAVVAGIWLVFARDIGGAWLHVKLTLVLFMVFFHVYCGARMDRSRRGEPTGSATVYRLVCLVPLLLITGVIYLVSAKPF